MDERIAPRATWQTPHLIRLDARSTAGATTGCMSITEGGHYVSVNTSASSPVVGGICGAS